MKTKVACIPIFPARPT